MAEDFLGWTTEKVTFDKQVDYHDDTSTPALTVNPSTDLVKAAATNSDQIADKKFAKDVRKSLSQWVLLAGYMLEKGLITLQQFQAALNSFEAIMENRQTDLEQEFKDVIANATVDSELINARNSNIYGKFPTLDGRLENIEQMLQTGTPSGYLVTINHGLGRNPEVTVSYYEDAIGTEIEGLGKAAIFGGTNAKFVYFTATVDANNVKIELPDVLALEGHPVYQPGDRCWYIIDKNRILRFDLGVRSTDNPNVGDQSQP